MLRAVHPFAPDWYTPTVFDNRDQKKPAQFLLRGLDGAEQAQIAADVTVTADALEVGPRALSFMFRVALLDWKDFKISETDFAEFSADTSKNQALLPYPLQQELSARIITLTYAGPDDKKKS